ncbi:hypothetical protein GCM10009750_22810 [Agromyces salentinus]|uniref:HTH marR-type domain-containing protein n=2 Tax=Agromyces salentinus TaxID=269421 RepID=A0ABP4Z455_9MICO
MADRSRGVRTGAIQSARPADRFGAVQVRHAASGARLVIQRERAAGPRDNGGMTHADEVDRIVEDWERERPDLDFAPLQVLSRVARLSKHLDRARRQAFARSELESSEFDVLSALRRAGAPFRLSPKQLLQQTLVSSGTMTNRIDRLVERGLVTRQTDPNDGRGILVEMSQAGLTRVDAAITRLVDAEAELLSGLPAAEQKRLAGLLRKLSLGFD